MFVHIKWTSTLPDTLWRPLMENYNDNFAQTIIQAIQDDKHITVPVHTHVQPQSYISLLYRMHSSGLLP